MKDVGGKRSLKSYIRIIKNNLSGCR